MHAVGWVVAAVVVAILLTLWVTFTVTRLDRLHARCDAARAALDAQLVRRAAALQHAAESPDSGVAPELRPEYDRIARHALDTGEVPGGDGSRPDDGARSRAENAVGRAVGELVETADAGTAAGTISATTAAELREASARVLIARRFYNDAVRDTRALRARRLPRSLHLARVAGRRDLPQFFDIDDTLPARAVTAPAPPSAAPAPTPVSPTPVSPAPPSQGAPSPTPPLPAPLVTLPATAPEEDRA